MKNALMTILGLAMAGTLATPALAGECPAGQAGSNSLSGAATMPAKVTDDVIGALDLGPEINVSGRSLRLRKLVLKPGGVVPLHSHNDRPAIILTASGSVTEFRSTCQVPIVHKAGDVVEESRGTSHWWKNTGSADAILYSADVHQDEKQP